MCVVTDELPGTAVEWTGETVPLGSFHTSYLEQARNCV